MHDVDGLNAGYARLLLDEYLENPDAVSAEWRALFESGATDLAASLPGLARLLETARNQGNGATNGHTAPAPLASETPDLELLGGVATSMALVNALKLSGTAANSAAPPVDTFAGKNVLAIVLEIDKTVLTVGGPVLGIWSSTHQKS